MDTDEPVAMYEIPAVADFFFRIAPDFSIIMFCQVCAKYTKPVATLLDAIAAYNSHVCKEAGA